ncbi:hypothetical protein F4604DRAFT_1677306 [Suillus subluteus]|nr:hypothetical protein F4604DRAFT_1677306 [Suillus subluteus]
MIISIAAIAGVAIASDNLVITPMGLPCDNPGLIACLRLLSADQVGCSTGIKGWNNDNDFVYFCGPKGKITGYDACSCQNCCWTTNFEPETNFALTTAPEVYIRTQEEIPISKTLSRTLLAPDAGGKGGNNGSLGIPTVPATNHLPTHTWPVAVIDIAFASTRNVTFAHFTVASARLGSRPRPEIW